MTSKQQTSNEKESRNLKLEQWGNNKIEDLEKTFEIDLKSIFFSKEKQYFDIKKEAATLLISAIDKRNKNLGFTELLSDGSDPVMTSVNLSMPLKNLQTISTYKSDKIEQYYKDQTDHFSQMVKETSTKAIARKMEGAGLFNVSNHASLTTAESLIDGIPLIGSIVAGIKATAGKFINYVTSFITDAIAWALGQRPSIVTGMVINGTTQNLLVHNWEQWNKKKGDLYLNQGHLDEFMADHEGIFLDSPDVQVRGCVDISDTDDFDYMAFAGSYVASKNETLSVGYYGTEGTIIFTGSSKKKPVSFAHEFAVPYSGKNGTNIKYLDNNSEIKKLNDTLFEKRGTYKSDAADHYKLTSAINSEHGQKGLVLATIIDSNLK